MLKWTKPMRLHIRPHTFSRLGVGPGVWALRERLVCNQVIQTSCCLSCYADNLALVQWGLADRHVDCWWQMVRMMCSTWWEHQSFFAFATVSTRCRVGMQVVNPLVNPSVHLVGRAGTLAGTRAGRGLPGTARWEPGICYWLTGFLAARRPVGISWNAWSVTWLAKALGGNDLLINFSYLWHCPNNNIYLHIGWRRMKTYFYSQSCCLWIRMFC